MIKEIYLDTVKTTLSAVDMSKMFFGCRNLIKLELNKLYGNKYF